MAYAEFLEQFATAQGVASVDELLSKHADRYAFQIGRRDRAKRAIQLLQDNFSIDFKGKKVLDVGCAYGSLSIEIAKLGATVVGIDISDKWLKLGEVNARGEADVKLINCDASTFAATKQLGEDGPFDIIIVNDVFEHIYDTAGLVANLSKLMAPGGRVYFKVPNGLATRDVLQEGHKRTKRL
jgi:2-polyprenyl-3-methyl-5-hydroxy-6-metoxy-1,4-benzoquinol methylase